MSAHVEPGTLANPFWLLAYRVQVLNVPACECPEPHEVVIATVISKS